MASERGRVSFTVPAGAGSYAPEAINLGHDGATATTLPAPIYVVTALVETVVATAVIELWLLKVGGNPATAGDYFLASPTLSGAAAGSANWTLGNWRGVQLRCKSGGTAGAVVVSASAWNPDVKGQ